MWKNELFCHNFRKPRLAWFRTGIGLDWIGWDERMSGCVVESPGHSNTVCLWLVQPDTKLSPNIPKRKFGWGMHTERKRHTEFERCVGTSRVCLRECLNVCVVVSSGIVNIAPGC